MKINRLKLFSFLLLIFSLSLPACEKADYWGDLNPQGQTLHQVGIFVSSTTGDDVNPGTWELPVKTITKGLDEAVANGNNAVYVAAGTYDENITLRDGISLYGGYNPDDWNDHSNTDRTNPAYQTIIHPASGIAITGNAIMQTTVIDGFTIRGDTAIFNQANSSPLITNNTIVGLNGVNTYGIHNVSSTPTIGSNIIEGGLGTNSACGIFNVSSDAVIRYNSISGSGSNLTLNSYGVYNMNSTPVISYCIINSGHGNPVGGIAYGIYNLNSPSKIRHNNITGCVSSETAYGIYINAMLVTSLVVHDNIIRGGPSSSASYGVWCVGGLPLIYANEIHGSDDVSTTSSTGLYLNNSIPNIFNNIIFGGSSASSSCGILIVTGNARIYNNTIDGGNGSGLAYGIIIQNASPRIDNNIIYTTSGTTRIGIFEINGTSDPFEVKNNDLFDCPTALYRDFTQGDLRGVNIPGNLTEHTDGSGFVLMTPPPASADGNVRVFLDIDTAYLRILGVKIPSPSDPADLVKVTQGGLQGDIAPQNWGFSLDKDGLGRTPPWSMGAYEY